MIVASYLPPLLQPRLTDAVKDIGAEHIRATSWNNLEETILRYQVGVIVLDPYADRTMRAREVARLIRHFPSTPVVAYTQFVPPAMRALALLSKRGLHETVLYQYDDGRARFGRLLIRASTRSLTTKMLEALQPHRRLLHPAIADAVEDLFEQPHRYNSARDLVFTSGTPLTSLYRAFTSAGLAPPKNIFIAARVLHATSYLRDPGYSVQSVAQKMGYRHPRVLTQHTLAVFGLRPSRLRHGLEEDDIIPKLLKWVQRS